MTHRIGVRIVALIGLTWTLAVPAGMAGRGGGHHGGGHHGGGHHGGGHHGGGHHGGGHHGGGDQDECIDLDGDFSAVPVAPEDCDSPVAFCTLGTLTGDIDGSYAFTMLSAESAPTAEHPSRQTFTGESLIETDCGTLYGDDTGEIWFDGDAGFVTRVTVYTGDGCFEDVTGEIIATGALDLITGTSVGTYTGELCEDDDRC
ncbi:MAG: hypothetical protein R3F61_32835 [Myxococcota bacterium]